MSEVDAGSLLNDEDFTRARGYTRLGAILDKMEENKDIIQEEEEEGAINKSGVAAKSSKFEDIIRSSRRILAELERTNPAAASGMKASGLGNVQFSKTDQKVLADDDIKVEFNDASSNEALNLDDYYEKQNEVINNIDQLSKMVFGSDV